MIASQAEQSPVPHVGSPHGPHPRSFTGPDCERIALQGLPGLRYVTAKNPRIGTLVARGVASEQQAREPVVVAAQRIVQNRSLHVLVTGQSTPNAEATKSVPKHELG